MVLATSEQEAIRIADYVPSTVWRILRSIQGALEQPPWNEA